MTATTTASESRIIPAAGQRSCSVQSLRPSVGLLQSWIDRAKPGECLTYHCGSLARDRAAGSPLTKRDRARLDVLAKGVLAAAEAGILHPLQRRLGTGAFCYFAVKARPALRRREEGRMIDLLLGVGRRS
jgi:hypothetical protein